MPHRITIAAAGCMFALMWLSASAVAAPAPMPWKRGDVAGSLADKAGAGWKIVGWERKLEFVRLQLEKNGAQTRVEVRYGSGKPGDYATRDYAVQPAPGVDTDMDAIRAVLADLQAWQARPDHVAFVVPSSAKKDGSKPGPKPADPTARPKPVATATPPSEATWSTPSEYGWGRHVPWLFLNLLAFAVFAYATPSRHAALLALVGGAIVLAWYRGDGLPIAWVNALQEGGTGPRIEFLYGHGIHAGPNHASVAHAVTGGHGYSIAHLAGLNVALWVAASVLFGGWAFARAGGWLGGSMTLLFALNGNALQTSTSELPAGLVVLYAVMLVAAGLSATAPATKPEDPASATPRLAVPAQIALALVLTVLLWGTRTETVAIGIAALGAVVWKRYGPLQLDIPGPTRRHIGITAAVVVGLGWVVVPFIGRALEPSCHEHWCYAVRAMQGEDLGRSLLWLPGFLVGTAMPVGVGLLLLGALVRVAIAPLAMLGLGVATIALYRVYFVAGHGITVEHYELYRYAAVFAPLCVILCTDLAAEIRASKWWQALTPRPRAAIVAASIVAMLIFPGATSDYDPSWGQPMATNQQVESRFLLATVRNHAKCALVSVVAAGGPGGQHRTEWALFGGVDSHVSPGRYPADQLDLLLSDIRHADCALFYRGLDCASIPGVCEPYTATTAIESYTFASRRYLADHFARPPADGPLTVSLHTFDRARSGQTER